MQKKQGMNKTPTTITNMQTKTTLERKKLYNVLYFIYDLQL